MATWPGKPRATKAGDTAAAELTCNCGKDSLAGSIRSGPFRSRSPMKTRPSSSMRRRSLPLVAAVMRLSPPALSDRLPAEVVTARSPALRNSGVVTEVPATAVVNCAAAGALRPMVVLSMVPLAIATSAIWNSPPEVRVARMAPLVPKRRSASSVVPRKSSAVVLALPRRPQAEAVTRAPREICARRPLEFATTIRS